MDDLISRQAAIEAIREVMLWLFDFTDDDFVEPLSYTEERYLCINKMIAEQIKALPTVQPALYGYKIEHLAYIARVMEKEGVTADYAVRTFDDMSRAIKMIIDEMQQKVEEALNG